MIFVVGKIAVVRVFVVVVVSLVGERIRVKSCEDTMALGTVDGS